MHVHLWEYFKQVAETLGDIPFVLQDHPQSTGVQMSTAVILRILKAIPTCVMVKHEEFPGLAKLSALRAASERGEIDRVSILGGNGGLFLPEELARGADGAMTGFAFPEALVEVVKLWFAGKRDVAEDLFDAYLPVIRHENQLGLGLALRKETLRRRGIIASSRVRAPGPALDADDQAELTHLLDRLERAKRQVGVTVPPLRLAGE